MEIEDGRENGNAFVAAIVNVYHNFLLHFTLLSRCKFEIYAWTNVEMRP